MNIDRDEIVNALHLIEQAAKITRKMIDKESYPNRIDSVTWRLADALLILGEHAKHEWPESPLPGVTRPTGRGAMISRTTHN